MLPGISEYDNSGESVSGVGDINGDGFDDLIIGAEGGGDREAGESYVVFGETSVGNGGSIDGGDGADNISGGNARDTLSGSAGNDVIDGGSQSDIINGGGGNDTLTGGAGDDELNGDGGNDMLFGGADDDELDGGSGSGDECNGNLGTDTATTDCEVINSVP